MSDRKAKKGEELRDEKGRWIVAPKVKSPGRPKETQEQKIVKKAVKEYLKDYEEGLAEALPEISPILISEAKNGKIEAFKEIHKVLGAHKTTGPVTAVQINFGDDRDKYA